MAVYYPKKRRTFQWNRSAGMTEAWAHYLWEGIWNVLLELRQRLIVLILLQTLQRCQRERKTEVEVITKPLLWEHRKLRASRWRFPWISLLHHGEAMWPQLQWIMPHTVTYFLLDCFQCNRFNVQLNRSAFPHHFPIKKFIFVFHFCVVSDCHFTFPLYPSGWSFVGETWLIMPT